MKTGKLKWFNDRKGFGFLVNENGEDVYTVNTVTDTELVAVQETGVGVITKTGTVNTDVAGTYQVVYSVKDAAGNLGTKVLTVIVTE